MWLLKTFMNPRQQFLECEYRNKCPTYWLNEMEMDMWSASMAKEFRTYVPIGYVYENT